MEWLMGLAILAGHVLLLFGVVELVDWWCKFRAQSLNPEVEDQGCR